MACNFRLFDFTHEFGKNVQASSAINLISILSVLNKCYRSSGINDTLLRIHKNLSSIDTSSQMRFFNNILTLRVFTLFEHPVVQFEGGRVGEKGRVALECLSRTFKIPFQF